MAKVNKPIKEFWELDKKPSYLEISKRKDDKKYSHNVKFVSPKLKRKKKRPVQQKSKDN